MRPGCHQVSTRMHRRVQSGFSRTGAEHRSGAVRNGAQERSELPSRIYISVGTTSRETRSVPASALRVCAACQASSIASKRAAACSRSAASSRTRPSARRANGSRYVLGASSKDASCSTASRLRRAASPSSLAAAGASLLLRISVFAGVSDSWCSCSTRVRSPRTSASRIRASTTRPYSSAPSASAAPSSRRASLSSPRQAAARAQTTSERGWWTHGVLASTACSALSVSARILCQLAASSSISSRKATPCSRWCGESRFVTSSWSSASRRASSKRPLPR
jgi:hypothetical protein